MKKFSLCMIVFFSFSLRAELATFGGGCFWCMEPPFEKLAGVKSVISGYMGGIKANASYKKVSSGSTNHIEVVQVDFDSSVVSYEKLLDVFWHNVDPTQVNGQFVDSGAQYRTIIFAHNENQLNLAKKSKEKLEKAKVFSKKIVTEIVNAKEFFPAEEYHQDYYKKNPLRYKFYRYNSGRDQFLDKQWSRD